MQAKIVKNMRKLKLNRHKGEPQALKLYHMINYSKFGEIMKRVKLYSSEM